jgi:hypothetical protein
MAMGGKGSGPQGPHNNGKHKGLAQQFPRAYRSWSQMLQRCNNPNNPFYEYYGGRGIKICERWNCILVASMY